MGLSRFPLLALLSNTWDCKPPLNEALADLPSPTTQALYVYGLGTGAPYHQCKAWLRADATRRLIFLEDDSALINGFLQEAGADAILADEQVHLAFLQNDADLDALAEQFPFPKIEFFALPSKNSRKKGALKLKLLRKTTLTHSLSLDREQGDQLFANFLKNLPHLGRSFYANALKGAFAGVPAIVCGAGPSLETGLLKNLTSQALLIAGGSTIAALLSQGIQPHFGMAVDPNSEEGMRFQNVCNPAMPLLYSTRLFPAVLQNHSGPLGYMRSGIGGAPELWIEEELKLTDPLLGHRVSPESISVTTMCVAWAEFLGCNPILFNGLDLAYTNKKRYAPGVIAEDKHPSSMPGDVPVRRKDRQGKWVETAVRWVMESDSISYFAKQCPNTRFINTTAGGLGFRDIPFEPLSQIQFPRRDLYREVAERVHAAPRLRVPDMQELQLSLKNTIRHLRILTGELPGSKALAEIELKEELAVSILFYDVRHTDWAKFLALAIRYDLVFMEFVAQRPNGNA